MCWKDKILISILLFVFILFPMNGMPQEIKENQKIFKGVVVEISEAFITVGRTTIALPKDVKTLDAHGTSVSFETIRKGDFVSVTIDKNLAVIQRTSGSAASKNGRVAKRLGATAERTRVTRSAPA